MPKVEAVVGSPQWTIEQEQPAQAESLERLVGQVFGPGRFAKSAYRLREGVEPEPDLGFVAVEGERLLGSVRFWPIRVGEQPALLLGPLAVAPAERGRGMGIALMNRGITEAQRLGHRAILLVGDASYYARVGFAPLPRNSVEFLGPVDRGRLLGLALAEGALDNLRGSVVRARLDEAVCAAGAPVFGPIPSGSADARAT